MNKITDAINYNVNNLFQLQFYSYRVMQIQEEQIEMAKIKIEEPKTKVAEVQTMFRESEA